MLLAWRDRFSLMVANQLPGVTVVGTGMISGASQRAIEAVGLSFIFRQVLGCHQPRQ